MGIELGSQFTEQASLPLDDRTIFSSTTTMEALAAGRRYHGLVCFITDTSANYICDSALSWQVYSVGGGGGSATVILNIDGGRANEIYGPGMVVDGGSAT